MPPAPNPPQKPPPGPGRTIRWSVPDTPYRAHGQIAEFTGPLIRVRGRGWIRASLVATHASSVLPITDTTPHATSLSSVLSSAQRAQEELSEPGCMEEEEPVQGLRWGCKAEDEWSWSWSWRKQRARA